MNALVTGGAGFIGSAVARALVESGHTVRVIDNLVTGFKEQVPQDAEFVEANINDSDRLADACTDIDVVFHHAAIRSVPKSVDIPMISNEANVTGTLNLLNVAASTGVRRLIYASSSSIYGDREAGAVSEDERPDPLSPYAVSKLAGEHYSRVWTRLGRLSTVSLRYFNVFGPGQHPESKYAAVCPAFISKLINDEPPEVHWDGEQGRDFTYVDDVVAANLLAAEAGTNVDGEVFNIGGGEPKTVNQVLQSISEALGKWIDPIHRDKRAGDVRHTHADISKAKTMLGWTPSSDWNTAIKSTIAWFT